MNCQLSTGSLATLMSGGDVDCPVMQVLGCKKIASGGLERYRLLVSDGVHLNSYAMLATQLNDMVLNGQLVENTVIRVDRHIISAVNNASGGTTTKKRILIILQVTVVQPGHAVGMKIGNPVPMADTVPEPSNNPQQSSNQFPSSPVPAINKRTASPAVASKLNGSVSSDNDGVKSTHPIVGLNPYQNRWVIKARVMAKTNIRTWSKATGDGKLFSMDLVDESGAIRATAFNDQCDKFYDMMQINKVYFVSRGTLKPANKKFTTIPHDFEMTFNNDTTVLPCNEDDSSIPQLKFNVTPLNIVKDLQPDSIIDVIGICQSAGEIQSLVARTTKREIKKRDVTLVDTSMTSVNLTLWDTVAEEFDASLQPVIAIRGARISEYNGSKSLSLSGSAVLQINPDITEAHKLRGWYDSLPSTAQFDNTSLRTTGEGGNSKLWTLREARLNRVGTQEKPDYFTFEGTIFYIQNDKAIYKACPSKDCQKKVIDLNNDMYRCEKCNREYPDFKYRLILPTQIGDWTGNQWTTIFQDLAEPLLNATAEEVGKCRPAYDNSYDNYFKKPLFKKYQFRLRAKMETYNNETKLRVQVVGFKPIDYKESCKRMLLEIKQLAGISINN